MSKNYFKGKNAVITGAASGIGKEFAIKLAKLGTNLVISDINMERLDQVKNEIEALGVKVIALKCNVTKNLEVKKMSEVAISEMKDIHFLFSNAGIAVGGPFEHLNVTSWKRIININLWGMIYVVTAFIPKMVEQGFGHVIVTSSIAGSIGVGGLVPYSTTKFANSGFCEAIYGEYKHKGLDVSIVCPFPIKTNLIESVGISIPPVLLEEFNSEEMKKGIEAGKQHYWNKFTEKGGFRKAFGGGMELELAVKKYIKQIKKKKLYIFEKRLGRLGQFTRGFAPKTYKKTLNFLGKKHIGLMDTTFEEAIKVAEQEREKK